MGEFAQTDKFAFDASRGLDDALKFHMVGLGAKEGSSIMFDNEEIEAFCLRSYGHLMKSFAPAPSASDHFQYAGELFVTEMGVLENVANIIQCSRMESRAQFVQNVANVVSRKQSGSAAAIQDNGEKKLVEQLRKLGDYCLMVVLSLSRMGDIESLEPTRSLKEFMRQLMPYEIVKESQPIMRLVADLELRHLVDLWLVIEEGVAKAKGCGFMDECYSFRLDREHKDAVYAVIADDKPEDIEQLMHFLVRVGMRYLICPHWKSSHPFLPYVEEAKDYINDSIALPQVHGRGKQAAGDASVPGRSLSSTSQPGEGIVERFLGDDSLSAIPFSQYA